MKMAASFNPILAAIGENVIPDILLCLINSKVTFAKDI
jgi:hypothetical protein